MHTYIALLRGINVSGKHRLPMSALIGLLEELGAARVATYIQSGNVVFEHRSKSAPRLAGKIETAVDEAHGFRPGVLLLTPGELDAVIAANPFPRAASAPNTLHVTFLESAPEKPDLARLDALKTARERYVLDGRAFYLHAPDGIGRSKLAARIERALGVQGTARNWRTVLKLQAMAGGDDPARR